MKFRIKKDSDGWYFAEYKRLFFWCYLVGSYSAVIEKTEKACKEFNDEYKTEVIKEFEL